MPSTFTARLVRRIGGVAHTCPAKLSWPGGVASFTFDDFPKSSLSNGGAILAAHGCRGTFYTAMRLAGETNHLGKLFDLDDILDAHRSGHEIACHTYTHLDCRNASSAAIVEEVLQNSAAIAAQTGIAPSSFAYPHGSVSVTAKRVLKRYFSSSRGIHEGVNVGAIDLAELEVVSVYYKNFDAAALQRTVDSARANNAWALFYTHDVREQPSPGGCTPAQFASLVAYTVERLPVLPVREVVAALPAGAPAG